MTSTESLLLILLLVMVSGYCSQEFRFDYEFNEQAGGWLKFHIIPATWEEARMRCHAEGAVLASPLTNQLKAAIISFVEQQTDAEEVDDIFSGVHATFSKGDYSSVEGVPLSRLAVAWAPGEPDNYENSESCLLMNIDVNGTMADTFCGDVLPYVCYKRETQLTITECGTTDPEYFLETRTGSCYKYHKHGLIWSEAYMTCAAEGGHLLIINSEVEAEAVVDIMNKPANRVTDKYKVVSVGFHDMSVHQNFMTIHGETLTEAGYEQWGGDNPSNSTMVRTGDMGEQCGSILRGGSVLMNDVYCHAPVPFICEMTPNSLR